MMKDAAYAVADTTTAFVQQYDDTSEPESPLPLYSLIEQSLYPVRSLTKQALVAERRKREEARAAVDQQLVVYYAPLPSPWREEKTSKTTTKKKKKKRRKRTTGATTTRDLTHEGQGQDGTKSPTLGSGATREEEVLFWKTLSVTTCIAILILLVVLARAGIITRRRRQRKKRVPRKHKRSGGPLKYLWNILRGGEEDDDEDDEDSDLGSVPRAICLTRSSSDSEHTSSSVCPSPTSSTPQTPRRRVSSSSRLLSLSSLREDLELESPFYRDELNQRTAGQQDDEALASPPPTTTTHQEGTTTQAASSSTLLESPLPKFPRLTLSNLRDELNLQSSFYHEELQQREKSSSSSSRYISTTPIIGGGGSRTLISGTVQQEQEEPDSSLTTDEDEEQQQQDKLPSSIQPSRVVQLSLRGGQAEDAAAVQPTRVSRLSPSAGSSSSDESSSSSSSSEDNSTLDSEITSIHQQRLLPQDVVDIPEEIKLANKSLFDPSDDDDVSKSSTHRRNGGSTNDGFYSDNHNSSVDSSSSRSSSATTTSDLNMESPYDNQEQQQPQQPQQPLQIRLARPSDIMSQQMQTQPRLPTEITLALPASTTTTATTMTSVASPSTSPQQIQKQQLVQGSSNNSSSSLTSLIHELQSSLIHQEASTMAGAIVQNMMMIEDGDNYNKLNTAPGSSGDSPTSASSMMVRRLSMTDAAALLTDCYQATTTTTTTVVSSAAASTMMAMTPTTSSRSGILVRSKSSPALGEGVNQKRRVSFNQDTMMTMTQSASTHVVYSASRKRFATPQLSSFKDRWEQRRASSIQQDMMVASSFGDGVVSSNSPQQQQKRLVNTTATPPQSCRRLSYQAESERQHQYLALEEGTPSSLDCLEEALGYKPQYHQLSLPFTEEEEDGDHHHPKSPPSMNRICYLGAAGELDPSEVTAAALSSSRRLSLQQLQSADDTATPAHSSSGTASNEGAKLVPHHRRISLPDLQQTESFDDGFSVEADNSARGPETPSSRGRRLVQFATRPSVLRLLLEESEMDDNDMDAAVAMNNESMSTVGMFLDGTDRDESEGDSLMDIGSVLSDMYNSRRDLLGLSQRSAASRRRRSSTMTVQTNTDVWNMSYKLLGAEDFEEGLEGGSNEVIESLVSKLDHKCVSSSHRRKLKNARLVVRVVLGSQRKDYKMSVACFEAIDIVTSFRKELHNSIQELSKGHQVLSDVKQNWSVMWHSDDSDEASILSFPSLSLDKEVDDYEYCMILVQKICQQLQPGVQHQTTPNTYTVIGSLPDPGSDEDMSLFLGSVGGLPVSLPLNFVDCNKYTRTRLTPYKSDQHYPLSLQDALRVVRSILGPSHKRVSHLDCLRAIQMYGLLKIQSKTLFAQLQAQRVFFQKLNQDLEGMLEALESFSSQENGSHMTPDTMRSTQSTQAQRIADLLSAKVNEEAGF